METCSEHGQHSVCPACGQCDFLCECTTTEREEQQEWAEATSHPSYWSSD